MTSTILAIDDEANILALIRMILEDQGHRVVTAHDAESALAELQNLDPDVILSDLRMPGMGGEEFVRRVRAERTDIPIIIITAHGTISSAVESIHAGASDYLTKPFEPAALEIAVHNALKLRQILKENARLKADASAQAAARRRLVGTSARMQQLMTDIARVAPVKTNVLITGESGTGKELVARTIHELGRRDKPWVAINCSAIPRELLESELFGFVKGAFSGATHNRPGRLEQAQGGTLFLDEIGELNIELQAKLLRVLQEREYSPLGSNQVRTADIRLLAATNRNLQELVREGRFREDLLYRLDVYNINVPPLRERRDDIPLLANTFLRELSLEMDRGVVAFTEDALAALQAYPWPGNIRELHNAVERALLTCASTHISSDALPLPRPPRPAPPAAAVDPDGDLQGWLERLERDAIVAALEACDGVQARAAERLGINERSLWHRIKKLGIRVSRRAT
ncbi:MAG: sigma-54 dependent transcriptional regulator [Gammaproteobacteria bacterium]|nr:sigma-54 dependent transcriptional regulator [Gammaproteobacteria bacterium]